MLIDRFFDDGVIRLRCLYREDVGDKYFGWINDPDINRYLEIHQNLPANVSELMQFVTAVNDSQENFLFGIFLLDGTHIGNIKLGPINVLNQQAEVGLLVVDKQHWGKGFAARAIRLVSDFAFRDLRLTGLTAGMRESNQGAFRAFLKAGYFSPDATQCFWQSRGNNPNQLWLGLANPQQASALKTISFGKVQSLVFIGGGNLMLSTIAVARSKGFVVGAILSPRHAGEIMTDGISLLLKLQNNNYPTCVAVTVSDVDPLQLGNEFGAALALCFGPAWIFPELVRERFPQGMLNFNGIPIPHYLGGAHYTWQILNGHQQAACHIQRIMSDVDRGDLLMSETFDLSQNSLTPKDYFLENEEYAGHFLARFLDKLIAKHIFPARPFADLNIHRLYFPRLITAENGWIDWSWSGNQIIAFCRAFGPPYPGASTRLNGIRIYLKLVAFIVEPSHLYFHPFCSGLIVRCLESSFFVSVVGGLLQVNAHSFDKEDNTIFRIREGDRLFTDTATLERARIYRPQISVSGNLI